MQLIVADQRDDVNAQVRHKLQSIAPFPDFVTAAEPVTKEATAALSATVFADPVQRKFPCHTKAAVYLSQLYFLEARHNYPTEQAAFVQGQLDKAAGFLGIGGHTKSAATTWEAAHSAVPPKLANTDYAMVVNHGGNVIRHYPIHNAGSVKVAATQFYGARTRFPYPWRMVASRKILRKSSDFGVAHEPHVQEYLEKAAGFGSTIPKMAAEKIAQRVLQIPDTHMELRGELAQLSIDVSNMKRLPSSDEMTKLATILDNTDRITGLYRQYGSTIELPEEVFFYMTEKRASDTAASYLQLTNGSAVPLSLLADLPLGKVAQAMGDDFVRATMDENGVEIDIDKFATIAATLPRNDAIILESAIRAAGKLEEKSGRAKGSRINWDEAWSKESWDELLESKGLQISNTDFRTSAKVDRL